MRAGHLTRSPDRAIVMFISLAVVLALGRGLRVRAAQWRLFGVESLSGYLALKSEGYSEQRNDANDLQYLEEQARLSLGSYVFHPRFLSVTADTLFGYRSGTGGSAGLRNLDTGAGVELLRENMLSLSAAARSKVERLEQDYIQYDRRVDAGAAQAALRGARLSATVKYESADTVADSGRFPSDKQDKCLTVDSSLRLRERGDLKFRYQGVATDDRLDLPDRSSRDSRYSTAELSHATEVQGGRGRLNLRISGWRSELPVVERRSSLLESWSTNWTDRLRSTEDLEITHRALATGMATTYQGQVGLTQALSDAWSLSGSLGGTHNQMPADAYSAVYRGATTLAYRGNWRGIKLAAADSLAYSQTKAGPDRTVPVRAERYALDVTGAVAEPLLASYVDLSSVRVYDPLTKADWTNTYCQVWQSGSTVYLRWVAPTAYDEDYPYARTTGATIDVLVDYDYRLPAPRYAELGNALSVQGIKEFVPGTGVEVDLNHHLSAPQPLDGVTAGEYAARHEVGLQGFFKKRAWELRGGAAAGSERDTLFAQGSLAIQGWTLSEMCRMEFYDAFRGESYETRASKIIGLAEKTHITLDLGDRTYRVDGHMTQGITSARARTAWLFSPFARLEVEARVEANRALKDIQGSPSANLALDTKFLWQQGQLDLTAGYEMRQRTYDDFGSQRIYVLAIRRF